MRKIHWHTILYRGFEGERPEVLSKHFSIAIQESGVAINAQFKWDLSGGPLDRNLSKLLRSACAD